MFALICLAEAWLTFCALAYEITIARLLAPYAGMTTDTWTTIIAAFLLAMSLGSHLGGVMATGGGGRRMLVCAAAGLGAAAICIAFWPPAIAGWDAIVLATAPTEFWRIVLFVAAPCIPAGLLLGLVTPLLMMCVLSIKSGNGRAIGLFYAAGAFGSVAGALAGQWLFLDYLGVSASIGTLGAMAMAAALMLCAMAVATPASRRQP